MKPASPNRAHNPMRKEDTALNAIAAGVLSGSVVWQVDAALDYKPFAAFFAAGQVKTKRQVVYFHFTDQKTLALTQDSFFPKAVNPQAGFEPFIDDILRAIQEHGNRRAYLFDCLSPLAADWYSDQMVGNFFSIICDALRTAEASACFAILRNQHSQYAVDPITQSAHAVLDVCRYEKQFYVQPLKVDYPRTVCRHRLHVWTEQGLSPVNDSHIAASVLTSSRRDNLGLARHHLGIWSQTFVEAGELLQAGKESADIERKRLAMRDRILRMAVSRDERVLGLVKKYFTLEDMVFLGTRMLGTGLIGGKAADMLLARAALLHKSPEWYALLETHDSFFVPSDVFYTFLVQNKVWPLRRQLLNARGRADIAKEAQHYIHIGSFPPHIMKRFSDMLDYFGETPLVVRSSSLLEDSFGNAFSGKYESVFCMNQGDRVTRLDELTRAIKTVYASAMSREALEYRAVHGLLERDEQMAILVQRVAGSFHGSRYFPHLAAVGFSFNPFVWHEDINPRAGVLRLVCGLGTRAVNRSDDDYTRLVALNAPKLRVEQHDGNLPVPAQQWVDVLDMDTGKPATVLFRDIAPMLSESALRMIASEDAAVLRAARKHKLKHPFALRLSFERLLSQTDFPGKVKEMLAILEKSYGVPVDVEFAVNFSERGDWRIHLLQCRPMQVKGMEYAALPKLEASPDQVILKSTGPVIGRSRLIPVDYVVYVVPEAYASLPEREQYGIARIIGEINRRVASGHARGNLMLIGPGRWGSTTPTLGIPVSFTEINRAAAICEVLALREGLVTEVSLGTHFFNDLVEVDMLYLALTHGEKGACLDTRYLDNAANRLSEWLPEAVRFEKVIRLINPGHKHLLLHADVMKQHVCLYRE